MTYQIEIHQYFNISSCFITTKKYHKERTDREREGEGKIILCSVQRELAHWRVLKHSLYSSLLGSSSRRNMSRDTEKYYEQTTRPHLVDACVK